MRQRCSRIQTDSVGDSIKYIDIGCSQYFIRSDDHVDVTQGMQFDHPIPSIIVDL